jgi:hypothetical protein
MTRIPRNRKELEVKVKHLPPNADKAIEGDSDRISFSFRYLNLKHAKFNIDSKTTQYFIKLMDRLKDISSIEKSQLTGHAGYSGKTLRCHSIKWEDTTEKGFGLPNEDTVVEKPMQFSLSANEHGRIHGFFVRSVFYIVWLDPEHKLYSNRG